MTFSTSLQNKITKGCELNSPISLGAVSFASNLLFAPMAGISNKSYRRLMEDLGAGGTVSELISAKAITYKNKKTIDMLKLAKQEKNVGLQIFGQDASDLAYAAQVAAEYGAKFVDINLGCPVRKVVNNGGGSALLKEPAALGKLLSTIKSSLSIPLSIKIRTGWDADGRNADEIIKVAYNEGIEWVAIHGRTRSQQYRGKADWEYIEHIIADASLPIIGNGDLHSAPKVRKKLEQTSSDALMIARGALRFPFIFLESIDPTLIFTPTDYCEVLLRLGQYFQEDFTSERLQLVQLRKHAAWFAAGYPHSAKFRQDIFLTKTLSELEKLIAHYFQSVATADKKLDLESEFMTSGHG